jgi:peptidoglycan/xylan/chitin deacetylase (PgdA/CDA1 family)
MMKFVLLLILSTGLFVSAQDILVPDQAVAPPLEDPSLPDDGIRVAVLGYHDFSETAPETAMRISTAKFRKQMETIRELGLAVISMEDFTAWKTGEKTIPEKSVVLTFDDGWKSVYTDAFPILKEFGYPYTLYLYKNYVDGGGKALTTSMIREMIDAGASLGSHSVSHPFPIAVKNARKKGPHEFDAYLRKEMGESKRFLESKFKAKINSYAFPGGFYTEEMLDLADEFGYDLMFTVQPGKVKRSLPNVTLPRYIILGNHDPIFTFATTFREAATDTGLGTGTIAGLIPTTPHPVMPQAGAIINTRLPEITADLSDVENLDPATLVMKVAGFGEVPAEFTPETSKFSWQVNRRLRHPTCQVSITWKDSAGKSPATPLRWSFQIDRHSAYLPDGE